MRCTFPSLTLMLHPLLGTLLALPRYYQHVTCHTRHDKALDHCCTTTEGAYRARHRATLGISDHAMLVSTPTYRQKLKTVKSVFRPLKSGLVRQWKACKVVWIVQTGRLLKILALVLMNTTMLWLPTLISARIYVSLPRSASSLAMINPGFVN